MRKINIPLLAVAVVGIVVTLPVAILVGTVMGIARMTSPEPL